MSIEFEPMRVRPMTEQPNCVFHYIFHDGSKSSYFYAHEFNKKFPGALGWCQAEFTLKPPKPKDGEWWMCEHKYDGEDTESVLIFRNGTFFSCPKSHAPFHSPSIGHVTPLYKMERAKE